MLRCIRLYLSLVRFATSTALMFRMDTWLRTVMDIAYFAVLLFFYRTVFSYTDSLGGFNQHQVRIFVAMCFVLEGLHMSLFASGVHRLIDFVRTGELDYYLVRPVPTLFYITMGEFSIASLVNLVLALGILAWAVLSYPTPISAYQILFGAILLINGTLLFYILRVLFALSVFWTIRGDGSSSLFYALRDAIERPHQIYPAWLRPIFMTLLPFALMVSLPTEIIFSPIGSWSLVLLFSVSCGGILILSIVWEQALARYGSASS